MKIPLPIDDILEDVVDAMRTSAGVIVTAPPGAGKSTRVPPALLEAGLAGSGEIAVLQPRRLAASLLAGRVAFELGEKPGRTVGYQVRFEEVAGPDTKIRFMTEGILTRRLVSDPLLSGLSVVVLDEFHERHVQTDLALALLRRLQTGPRPELKIVVMSATLDPEPLSRYLSGAPVLRSEGRLFDVTVDHAAQTQTGSLETLTARALEGLLRRGLDGDVLVFLPGAAEIRRSMETLSALASAHDLVLAPLHGDLALARQQSAVEPGDRRKVILSTNVAESSITVEGVTAVIDSGLVRRPSFSAATGMNVLTLGRVCRASAVQRAGRAGRVRPGRCIRLFGSQDFSARPDFEAPEIARLDLAEAVLLLKAAGVASLRDFDWFEAPPPGSLDAAQNLLRRLGALSEGGELTKLGRSMHRFPLHPRLSRLVLEAAQRGQPRQGAALAALLGERDLRRRGPSFAGRQERRRPQRAGDSDVLDALDSLELAERSGLRPPRKGAMKVDAAALQAVRRARDHILAMVRGRGRSRKRSDDDLRLALLAAFPDRVAKLQASAGRSEPTYALGGGGSALLDEASVVRGAPWIVACNMEQRRTGSKARTVIRQASAVEPDWILELFLDHVKETAEVLFNESRGRVEARRQILYENLVVDESPDPRPDEAEMARVLFDAAWSRGWSLFDPDGKLEAWLGRAEFAARHAGDRDFPVFDEAMIRKLLTAWCEGKRSLKDLAAGNAARFFESRLTPGQARALAALAPERIVLRSKKKLRVLYARGREPYGSGRIQDFFGMRKGPTLAGGVPLLLHLLAPNGRAVQVTTDLEGFWERHYPGIARELRRRYPRHAWPEKPL